MRYDALSLMTATKFRDGQRNERAQTCLRHHSPPSDDIRRTSCAVTLLQVNDRLQQAIQVVVCSVIEPLKGIETFREIGRQ